MTEAQAWREVAVWCAGKWSRSLLLDTPPHERVIRPRLNNSLARDGDPFGFNMKRNDARVIYCLWMALECEEEGV